VAAGDLEDASQNADEVATGDEAVSPSSRKRKASAPEDSPAKKSKVWYQKKLLRKILSFRLDRVFCASLRLDLFSARVWRQFWRFFGGERGKCAAKVEWRRPSGIFPFQQFNRDDVVEDVLVSFSSVAKSYGGDETCS
jgi:hypothetical protein